MLFLVYRKDKPGSLDVRLSNYPAHLDYLRPYKDRLVVGGPTLGEGAGTNDENMTGSFLILDAENWEVVERFLAEDPFSRAGLFSTPIVDRWKHGRHNDE